MKRFILSIIIFTSTLLLYTSCIRDGEDLEGCKQYVRFVYDYNMVYTNLFSKQATKMNLYIYDSEDKFFCKISDERPGYFPDDYKMSLPGNLPAGKYTFVVWSGLYDDSYDYYSPEVGNSMLKDHFIKVKNYEKSYVDFQMKPLWHGISEVQISKKDNTIHTVSLIKDTKQFRIVMQDLTEGHQIDVNNYDFEIYSVNGYYNYNNQVSGNKIKYTPYFAYNDTNAGAVVELNTQRLMAESDNRLRITEKQSNNNIIDINLDKYLAALRLLAYKDIPYQEYLDRTDYFAIIFLIKSIEPEPGEQIAFEIKINEWYIREQESDL